MTAAAPAVAQGSFDERAPFARRVVWTILALSAVLAVSLLVLSFVPSSLLLGRLIGATGEARTGANTQELAASLGARLRSSAALVLVLSGGLWLVRGTFAELVAAVRIPRAVAWSREATRMLAGMTVLAAALRLVFITQPMRYDEALTFNEFASRPLYYGLSFYPDPNNHLLNTLLMHVAYVASGNQPWVLRLPAFLAGVLLVPATFWLADLLYGQRPAFLAAALVGVSSYIVEYSTNARGYTLQALGFVVMLALVVCSVGRQSHQRGALVLAAVVGALGAYTLPTMLYGVVIAAAWALLHRVDPKALLATGLILGLATSILYLPVLVISGADKLAGNRFVVPLAFGDLAPELSRTLGRTWTFWNRDVAWPLALLLIIGFGITLCTELRTRRVPLGLLAPAVCLVLVGVQRVAPFERVWLFLLPLYFAIAAAGLARFVDGRLLATLFGLAVGFSTLTSGAILRSDETGVFPDAEAVTQTLAPRLAPDDAVMTQLPASLPELQYYFPRFGLPTTVLVRPAEDAQNLWLIAPPGASPDLAGWQTVLEVQRYTTATLYELKR